MIEPTTVDEGSVLQFLVEGTQLALDERGAPQDQRGGQPVRVCEPWIAGAVFLRPDGIDAERHAEGGEITC
jgi:hypothetical protein